MNDETWQGWNGTCVMAGSAVQIRAQWQVGLGRGFRGVVESVTQNGDATLRLTRIPRRNPCGWEVGNRVSGVHVAWLVGEPMI